MDFDLTVLRACFIPIMELERELTAFPSLGAADFNLEDSREAIMSTLVLELMRMVLFT
jgi:hypothetical protein